jgi:FkbM family methyltransferase
MSDARRNSANHHGSSDLLLEFRHAKLHLGVGAGELNSYIELFVQDDYGLSEIDLQQKGSVLLDVGANIGIFSLAAAKRFPDTRIYAFEPSPEAYSRLVRNLELNNMVNVKPVKRAVYSSCSVVGFSKGSSTSLGSVIDSGALLVHAVTLDDFCSKKAIDKIDLIKIDVEGAEVEVLRGAQKTLDITDRLVAECHSAELATSVENLLSTHRFQKVSERRVPQGGGVLRFKKHEVS